MRDHGPELVIMYGLKRERHWIAITEYVFPPDNILKHGPTIFALTPHPVSCRWTNDDWVNLGKRLLSDKANTIGCL